MSSSSLLRKSHIAAVHLQGVPDRRGGALGEGFVELGGLDSVGGVECGYASHVEVSCDVIRGKTELMRRKASAEGCGVIENVLGCGRGALGVVLSRLRIVGGRDDLGGC
jgi:hypothetical protein